MFPFCLITFWWKLSTGESGSSVLAKLVRGGGGWGGGGGEGKVGREHPHLPSFCHQQDCFRHQQSHRLHVPTLCHQDCVVWSSTCSWWSWSGCRASCCPPRGRAWAMGRLGRGRRRRWGEPPGRPARHFGLSRYSIVEFFSLDLDIIFVDISGYSIVDLFSLNLMFDNPRGKWSQDLNVRFMLEQI